MEKVLTGFRIEEATWFYLSFFLIVAVYFRFNRILSLRNLDLAILLAISPGILLAHGHYSSAYPFLFAVSGLLLLRLVFDGFFTRRPRLEQNLNTQGLSFLGVVALVLLATVGWTADRVPESAMQTVEAADRLLKRQDAPSPALNAPAANTEDAKAGPAATVLATPFVKLPELAAKIDPSLKHISEMDDYAERAARLASIVAHLAVVVALLCIGRWLFGDLQIGTAMATLYLLLPCTAYDVARLTHVLPAALILWAIAAYRRPTIAGGLFGLACGTLVFPVFLLPLWLAFYDRRGAIRFAIAMSVVGAALVGSLALTSADTASFRSQMLGAIDWSAFSFRDNDGDGFWRPQIAAYRIPVFVAFCVGVTVLSIWPRHKTLEHLIAASTAIIVGTQFWYPQRGGVYSLWYLPLLLVVVFRPTLAHLLPPELNHKAVADQSNGQAPARDLVASAANGNAR